MCLAGTREAVHPGSRSGDAAAAGLPAPPVPHDHPREPEGVSRRALLGAGIGAAAMALLPAAPAEAHARRRRVADLTHVFSPTMPTYGGEKPSRETFQPPAPEGEFGFYNNRWTFTEHVGTHMDAPGHVIGGGRLSDDITPTELIAPAVVIDIRHKAARNANVTVTLRDIRRFERRHGRIPRGAAVLMNSGWAARWDAGDLAFRGTDRIGEFPFNFPGFDADACEFLVRRRDIVGVGVDTLSTDPGSSTTFPAHEVLGRADRWGLEALANLDQVPPRGATLTVGLVPWENGSGGPCRVLASW
jgi:kynurenine formamidase